MHVKENDFCAGLHDNFVNYLPMHAVFHICSMWTFVTVSFFFFFFESIIKVKWLPQPLQDAFVFCLFSFDFVIQVVVGVNISCCTGVQVTMPLVAMDTVKRLMVNLTANVSRCGDISRERN